MRNPPLDRSKDKLFKPVTRFGKKILAQANITPAKHFDIEATQNNIQLGVPSQALAPITISPDDLPKNNTFDLFDTIIKYPGEDTHRIPQLLGPTIANNIMAAASIQYAASPYAKDKIGIVFVRSKTLEQGVLQTAPDWHTHIFPTDSILDRSSTHALDLSDHDWNSLRNASPNMLADEFMNANICGTDVQKNISSKPVNNFITAGDARIATHIQNNPPFEHGSASTNTLSICSGSWHKSAKPTAEHSGLKRIFMVIAYLHTNESEAKWRADKACSDAKAYTAHGI